MASYCERYGETIHGVSNTFGPVPRWEGAEAEEVARQLGQMVPLDQLQVSSPTDGGALGVSTDGGASATVSVLK